MDYSKLSKKELIDLVKEKVQITGPASAYDYLKEMKIDYSQENFIIFALNGINEILAHKVLFKGGVDYCQVDAKIIFKYLLSQKNVSGFITAHNHPSGKCTPSPEDLKIFKKLKSGGDILSLQLIDNLIFTEIKFYSAQEHIF